MTEGLGKRLVIACGGTGGHLFPGIAVAEAWRKRGGESLLLISEKQIDTLATEGYEHLHFERMPSIGMPGLFSIKMPAFIIGFFKGMIQCRKLIRDFGADAVLGMGGFTSTAPLAAGWMQKLPTFVHESNSIPGRANKLNAKFASAVLIGFEECARFFPQGKRTEVVGTPLRPKLLDRPSKEESATYFGLDLERQTVMFMGGSQGAQRLNQLVAASLEAFEEAGLQVLHLTGPSDYDEVKPAYDALPSAGKALPFCSEVQYVHGIADLAICRSGAACLTELAYYEKPAVLIPYPFAADDHQTANAKIFSNPGAAELWQQDGLDEENFAGKIIDLACNSEKLNEMSRRMSQLAIPDASARVCDVIEASFSKTSPNT